MSDMKQSLDGRCGSLATIGGDIYACHMLPARLLLRSSREEPVWETSPPTQYGFQAGSVWKLSS